MRPEPYGVSLGSALAYVALAGRLALGWITPACAQKRGSADVGQTCGMLSARSANSQMPYAASISVLSMHSLFSKVRTQKKVLRIWLFYLIGRQTRFSFRVRTH